MGPHAPVIDLASPRCDAEGLGIRDGPRALSHGPQGLAACPLVEGQCAAALPDQHRPDAEQRDGGRDGEAAGAIADDADIRRQRLSAGCWAGGFAHAASPGRCPARADALPLRRNQVRLDDT